MPVVEEFLLVVSEGCPGCEMAKKQLQEMGRKGKNIRVVDVQKDDEAVSLVKALKIKSVPSFIVMQRDKGEKTACLVDVKGKVQKCADIEE